MPMNPEIFGKKFSGALDHIKKRNVPPTQGEMESAATEYQTREANRNPKWHRIEHLIGEYDKAVKFIPPGFIVYHSQPSKNGTWFETVVSVRFSDDKTTDFIRERVLFDIEETVPGEQLICHVSLKPQALAEKVRNKILKLAKQQRRRSNLSKVFRR